MNSDGLAQCTAQTQPLKSVDEIVAANNAALSQSSNATLTISGLIAATRYVIYCIATSSDGIQTMLATAVTNRIRVATLCCKLVTVNLNVKGVYAQQSQLNVVSLALDGPPSSSVTVVLSLSVLSLASPLPLSTGSTRTLLLPNNATFTAKSASLATQIGFIGTAAVGTYQLSVALIGP